MSEGIFRLKVVWAGICALIGGLAILLFFLGQISPEVFKRLALGTAVAALAAGGAPLLDATLKTRITLIWVGVMTGLSYAGGPNKWPEGAVIAVAIGAIFWISWWAVSWVAQGFKGKDGA